MEIALSPLMVSQSPAPSYQKQHMSPFYYGLAAIGATSFLLIAYNFLVVRWCWKYHQMRRSLNRSVEETNSGARDSTGQLIPISKYLKEETNAQACDIECSVCLSTFADGEDVRQLPECKHSFHADCIDMWLYSHSNCPLCRAAVPVSRPTESRAPAAEDSSEGGLPV